MTENHLSFDYDLAIVGGSIVGMTLAAALQNSGLKIVIIEAQTQEQTTFRRRAYALSLLSGRIYEQIGVWQTIFPQIAKFSQIRLSDGDDQKVVRFAPGDLGTPYLGYVADHGVLTQTLQNFIKDHDQITWLAPARVAEIEYLADRVRLKIATAAGVQDLYTRLVVGADGAKSFLRSEAGIKTRGWKYWQSCVTFTIKHTAASNEIAFERFWPTGPMGILPLPGNYCQIVWTAPHVEAKALQTLPGSEFLEKLTYHTGGLLGELELVGDRQIFPVQLMQSQRYTLPRLALIGDAAHCCHPVGGQGLNLGIRDAAALAEILWQAHQQGEDLGSLKVLKRYERWRKLENLVILAFTDLLDRVFSNNWLPLVWVRRWGLGLMAQFQPLKVQALQLMTGLKGKAPVLERVYPPSI